MRVRLWQGLVLNQVLSDQKATTQTPKGVVDKNGESHNTVRCKVLKNKCNAIYEKFIYVVIHFLRFSRHHLGWSMTIIMQKKKKNVSLAPFFAEL